MKDGARSLTSAAVILGMAGAVGAGILTRQRLEVGPGIELSNRPVASMTGFVASNSTEATIPPSELFYKLTQLIDANYVNPVPDSLVFSSGAVRGMILSLADPHSNFFNKEQFQALHKRQSGQFEGVGLEIYLRFDPEALAKLQSFSDPSARETANEPMDTALLIPEVVVSSVIPGSSAAAQGIQPGDRIVQVGDFFVITPMEVRRIRAINQRVLNGEIDESELTKIRQELADKADKRMTPERVDEVLTTGTSGEVVVGILTAQDEEVTKTLVRAKQAIKPLEPIGNALRLSLIEGAADALRKQLNTSNDLVLDLRGPVSGSTDELLAVLEVLLPAGEAGALLDSAGKVRSTLTVETGTQDSPNITLLVDETTSGVSEILALALSAHAGAQLQGREMSGQPIWVETVKLVTGDGYQLGTGLYRPYANEEDAS
jgi:carboxyl-terminal processing protease